jgi:hypothetical protein
MAFTFANSTAFDKVATSAAGIIVVTCDTLRGCRGILKSTPAVSTPGLAGKAMKNCQQRGA